MRRAVPRSEGSLSLWMRLLVFTVVVFVLLAGILFFAHLDGKSLIHHDSDHCAICLAASILRTVVVVLVGLLLLSGRGPVRSARPGRSLLIVRHRRRSLSSPRAPPVSA